MALLGEMRRRNIFKVSLAYAIVSWLIVQIANMLLPAFGAPQWVMQVLVLGLIFLFPIAVLLSWAYELTPEGFKATSDVDRTQSITVKTGKKLNVIVVVLLSLAAVVLLINNYLLRTEIPVDPDVAYRQSIAVLPFENHSTAEENADILTAGIHIELLSRLAGITELHVISRTSVFAYRDSSKSVREIGEELGVGSVLTGSVQRSGDELQVSVQLIDTRTDEQIWTDDFDREITVAGMIELQTDMAVAIADELEADLSDAEQARLEAVPTESYAAMDAYFRARQLVDSGEPASIRDAVTEFKRAAALDPEYSAAWAGIAEAWLVLPDYATDIDSRRLRREAASAAIRAISLDSASPDALAVIGWHLLLHNYDWVGAENAFRRALEIEPTNVNALHWYSHLLSWQGLSTDAIVAANLAVDADPLSVLMRANQVDILTDAMRWDEAITQGLSLANESELASLESNLWIAMLRAGRFDEAADQLLRWATVTGRDSAAADELAGILRGAPDSEAPGELSAELIARLDLGQEVPELTAALGQAEATLIALEDAARNGLGYRSLLSMGVNPSYDFLREEPRFIAILTEVGLDN